MSGVSENHERWVQIFKEAGGLGMEKFIDATGEMDVMTQAVLLIQCCRRMGRVIGNRQRGDKTLTQDQLRRLEIADRTISNAQMALNLVFEDYPNDFEGQYQFEEKYPQAYDQYPGTWGK